MKLNKEFKFVLFVVAAAIFLAVAFWPVARRSNSSNAAAIPTFVGTAQAAPAPLLAPPTASTSAVVTSVSAPMRFRVTVANLKEPVKFMPSTKAVRVTIECEASFASQFQKAFPAKGVPFYMDVTPIR